MCIRVWDAAAHAEEKRLEEERLAVLAFAAERRRLEEEEEARKAEVSFFVFSWRSQSFAHTGFFFLVHPCLSLSLSISSRHTHGDYSRSWQEAARLAKENRAKMTMAEVKIFLFSDVERIID